MYHYLEINCHAIARAPEVLALVVPICREVLRRKKHPFYTYKPDDSPDRNQLAFLQSQAPIRLVFGGNQSGKSRTVAQEVAYWLTGLHPYQKVPQAARIYCISASYRTLQEGIWRHLKDCLPEWHIQRRSAGVPGWTVPSYITMKNGAQVDFISGEGGEDARRKLQAAEIDLAIIDEEVDYLLWEELQARRLARGGRVVVCATLVSSEPWCLELEDRAEMGDKDVSIVRLSTYAAMRAGHVRPEVVREMEASLSPQEVRVRLLGQSRRYEGLVYPEFSRKHVIDPFPIPRDWTRYVALDPGYRTFGVLWAAVSPTGHYIIYHELYLHAKHYKEVANAIFAFNGYEFDEQSGFWRYVSGKSIQPEIVWIDRSAFGHHETGERKIAHLLAEYGLACSPAFNDVEAGIERCRSSLSDLIDGVPRMRVFSSCANFLKEIRSYRRATDKRPTDRNERPDAPVKRNDHLMDPWRYLELGGLHYKPPPAPWEIEDALRESQLLPLLAKSPAALLLREKHRKLLLAQKQGKVTIPHPGGIGTEF